MKKLLGISLIAVLTAAPAFATDVDKSPVSNQTSPATTTATPLYEGVAAGANDDFMASAGYVKGAYNAAIKAVNKTYDTLDNAITTETTNRENADTAINNKIGANQDGNFVLRADDAATTEVDESIVKTTVAEGLQTLQGQIDGLNTNSANTSLSNLTDAGTLVITNNVKTNAKDGGFTNTETDGFVSTVTTIDGALGDLDSRVVTNAANITTLNSGDTVIGSVDYKVKNNSRNGEFTAADGSEISATTLQGAINEVAADYQTAVNNEKEAREAIIGADEDSGKIVVGTAEYDTVSAAISGVSDSMTNDFAKKPNVQATIAESSVKVLTEWGSNNVSKRYIDAAEYQETAPSTKNGGIEAI